MSEDEHSDREFYYPDELESHKENSELSHSIIWLRTSLRKQPRRNWEFHKRPKKSKHDQENFQ